MSPEKLTEGTPSSSGPIKGSAKYHEYEGFDGHRRDIAVSPSSLSKLTATLLDGS